MDVMHTTASAAHITTRNVPADISQAPRDRRRLAAFIGHLELIATNRRTGRMFLRRRKPELLRSNWRCVPSPQSTGMRWPAASTIRPG
jgi:hypothetical protein